MSLLTPCFCFVVWNVELPIRMADFGVLHRNEESGALSGMTRVRRFIQVFLQSFWTLSTLLRVANLL